MTRNKMAVLGLAALALLAMSAFVASAQGNSEPGQLTCLGSDHETVLSPCDGVAHQTEADRHETNGKHIFEAGIAAVICENATFDITSFNGQTSTPKATPTYSNCEDSIVGQPAHVNHNGCEYEFHIGNTSGETKEEDEYKGTVDILCPTGPIIVQLTNSSKAVKCTIEIGEQKELGPIYFRNNTSAETTDGYVEAHTVTASANFTGGFFNCGVTNGVHNTKYTGNTTAQLTQEGVFKDGHVD